MWLRSAVAAVYCIAAASCGDNLLLGIGPPLERADVLFAVAHLDDDLIFMQPDVLRALRSSSVTAMYVAAGDSKRGFDHTQHLFEGTKHGYADAAGAEDWECGIVALNHGSVQHCRALDRPLSLIKVDLPDGGIPGEAPVSLRGLVEGRVHAVPLLGQEGGAATASEVIELLAEIADQTSPKIVHAQELAGVHGYDHSSHMFTSAFLFWALARLKFSGELTWHRGYNVGDAPITLDALDYAAAARMLGFFEACWGRCGPCGTSCSTLDLTHDTLLQRQYAMTRTREAAGRLQFGDRCLTEALTLGDCTTAPAFTLASTGEIQLGDRCLTTDQGGSIALADCTGQADQYWVLDPLGFLYSGLPPAPVADMSYDHVRCLDGTEGLATTAICGSQHQPHWQIVAP